MEKLKSIDTDKRPSYRTRVWWEEMYGSCHLMLEQSRDLLKTVDDLIEEVERTAKRTPS